MFSETKLRIREKIVTSCILMAFAASVLTPLAAQTTTATMSGTVTDVSGAVVAGAKVEVKNVGTGITQPATTDGQGRFRVPELPIGSYEVQATQAGFQTVVRRGITLTVGSEAVVDFTLPVGQAQQTVTVEAQASQVDTSSSAIANLVESTQMRELPLNGRNFEQLLSLAPGVQSVPASGGGFYGRQDNYSIAGSRPVGQQFLIDNTNFLTFFGHATGSAATGAALGLEAIAEFQTLTNTYSAQFGGNGAVVNAASKSGTNSIHGSAYEFLRNSAMDARSPFDGASPPPFRRNQFGGSAGGPVKKDKAFFFVNYEGLRQSLSQTSVARNVPDANAHNGYLPCSAATTIACNSSTGLAFVGFARGVAPLMALFPVGATSPTGAGIFTSVGKNVSEENYVLARMDYTFSTNDSIFARYVRDSGTYTTPFNGSPLPLFNELDTTANHFATIEERHIVSPVLVNLARVSFMRPTESAVSTTPLNPALQFLPTEGNNGRVVVAGTTVGPFMLLPYFLVPNHYVAADDIIWTSGSHNIKAGFSVERVQDNASSPQNLGGNYSFNSVLDFLQGNPAGFQGVFPSQTDSYRDLRELWLTPYIQDEWKFSRKLTLNMGLRYEWGANPTERLNRLTNVLNYATGPGYQPVPSVYANNNTTRNFAPRFGFAYDPFADHKTSIRGGFGIFYNLLTGKDFEPAYWLAPPFGLASQTPPVTFPAPGLSAVKPNALQGLYYYAGSTPYVMQYNLNIQRDMGKGMILQVGYVGSGSRHLLLTSELNPPQLINGRFGTQNPVGLTVPNARLNANFNGLSERNTVGISNYNALIASVNRRFANRFQTQVSYTYSKSMDNGSAGQGAENIGGAQPIENPYNAAQDYARSTFDRTHSLRISGVYELPFTKNLLVQGWRLSGIFSAASGPPFTILTGFDRVGLGGGPAGGARPNLNPGYSPNPNVGNPNKWFDPAAFSLQPAGIWGNLGRNTAIGPGLTNLDLALLKDTRIRKLSESAMLQFRAEFFNILNHPNYGLPANGIFSSGAGPNGTRNPAAGTINGIIGNTRQIQFGLKVIF
jgi:carboxypeptidase family protein